MDTNVAGLNKVYCFTTNAGYNGKVVTITDGVNTWERTIDSLSCVFMIPSMPAPAKKRYTVELHDGDATADVLYSRVIDLGFGDSVRIGLYTTDENADKGYVQSWVSSHAYSLPTASSSTKGGITVSDTTSNGLYMSGTGLYLRSASKYQKGGITVGKGLRINNGTLYNKASVNSTSLKLHGTGITINANSSRNVDLESTSSNFAQKLADGVVTYVSVVSYITNLTFIPHYFYENNNVAFVSVWAINPSNSAITIDSNNNFGVNYYCLDD